MIIEGNELSVFDLVACYAQRYQKTLLHFNLDKYNSLDTTKKATVTTYYQSIVDDYVLDILKQGGIFNTISFDDESAAGTFAASWFPLESQCPDADHYIHAYIVDAFGDITWQNKPTGKQ
tara:strand:+ start:11534 stop:11893 length:360 start_codon:yes stop_codon:yes gene_type:complete